jgi:ATP-dependent RNA helicase DDX24/MAK5
MSRTGQKKAKSTEVLNGSLKRRKLKATPNNSKSTQTVLGAPIATVSANDLPWREVTPPQRLDDAEGFLGLEEIDDVEIVRDAQGKQTRFQVSSSTSCGIQRFLTDPSW